MFPVTENGSALAAIVLKGGTEYEGVTGYTVQPNGIIRVTIDDGERWVDFHHTAIAAFEYAVTA